MRREELLVLAGKSRRRCSRKIEEPLSLLVYAQPALVLSSSPRSADLALIETVEPLPFLVLQTGFACLREGYRNDREVVHLAASTGVFYRLPAS